MSTPGIRGQSAAGDAGTALRPPGLSHDPHIAIEALTGTPLGALAIGSFILEK